MYPGQHPKSGKYKYLKTLYNDHLRDLIKIRFRLITFGHFWLVAGCCSEVDVKPGLAVQWNLLIVFSLGQRETVNNN
jgi:hypothetical protein